MFTSIASKKPDRPNYVKRNKAAKVHFANIAEEGKSQTLNNYSLRTGFARTISRNSLLWKRQRTEAWNYLRRLGVGEDQKPGAGLNRPRKKGVAVRQTTPSSHPNNVGTLERYRIDMKWRWHRIQSVASIPGCKRYARVTRLDSRTQSRSHIITLLKSYVNCIHTIAPVANRALNYK